MVILQCLRLVQTYSSTINKLNQMLKLGIKIGSSVWYLS